ncbi:MAG TPA: SRPBCC family protein [Moraxellaceae bacterium]|nr:SRPBCC family protein [Moraxellaceae bacterium]
MNKPPFTLPPRDTWIDHEVEVAADAATLYLLLSDLDNWPAWTPGLRAIRRWRRGPMRPGQRFVMVLDGPGPGLPLPCTVYRSEPLHLEWGGGALGSVIRHSLTLKPLDAGRTLLRHREYATGLLALATRPVARLARAHDERWSAAIVARFAGG